MRPGQYARAMMQGSVQMGWNIPIKARWLNFSLTHVMLRRVMMWKTLEGIVSRLVLNYQGSVPPEFIVKMRLTVLKPMLRRI